MISKRTQNQNTVVVFIDPEKSIWHGKLGVAIWLHEKSRITLEGKRLIWKFCKLQYTEIEITDWKRESKIRKRIRQGFPLSPYLFNTFINEAIIMLNEETKKIK